MRRSLCAARGNGSRRPAPRTTGCSRQAAAADVAGMWTYVLRHRLLLRAIYARSTPLG
ncbi:MAG: hypothetical protein MUC36_13835 [Planctomycetes bacterium]|jgi:hypothetical protein|nr:hypothetical protein [Planctomycetota bacterium]